MALNADSSLRSEWKENGAEWDKVLGSGFGFKGDFFVAYEAEDGGETLDEGSGQVAGGGFAGGELFEDRERWAA